MNTALMAINSHRIGQQIDPDLLQPPRIRVNLRDRRVIGIGDLDGFLDRLSFDKGQAGFAHFIECNEFGIKIKLSSLDFRKVKNRMREL